MIDIAIATPTSHTLGDDVISFACAGCGQKLQVPNDAAGKTVRCSLCKHVMTIAAPVALPPTVVLSHIDGLPSSLAQAGLQGGVTVASRDSDSAQDPTANAPNRRSVRDILAHVAAGGQRYQVAGEIARGGMGAVLRAVDCDIRREVAVKYLLDQNDSRKKARFIEEAQITGQLEHPNIVPVHELGLDAHKNLFFSMKMVKGRSLAQVLRELRESPRTSEKEYPLGRLLTMFVNICHALAYAHSRGVVHRDLKPANIMLGDFGEVYVMDWGLAKVLHHPAASESPADVIRNVPSFAWAEESSAGAVQTSRQEADDQTVDGSILGTAVYMPPEQAGGNLAAIDRRSDVYSLGAVLYEMLTLHPPIDKTGGFRATLQRVREGAIVPPQASDPVRARAGKIPAELAAVAMKALALKPEDRYQTVEALRGDMERFLEGRSVSVKEDTRRELLVKFIRRNKGFSLGAAAALVILLLSSILLLRAWLATNRAYAAYQAEQEAKRAQARQSVPAFVEAAHVAVQRRKFDDALAQVNVALDYDPDHGGARLLKGQLLAARKDFAAARPELEHYLKAQPADGQAAKLASLCARNRPDDPAAIAELADILLRQDLHTLAEGLLDAPEKLLQVYRHKIETAWPGLGKQLEMHEGNELLLTVGNERQVLILAPLQGIPLRTLYLNHLKIRDLSPLKGMPLNHLILEDCDQITDLTPLRGMPLTYLNLASCVQVADLKPLAGMPLTFLHIGSCRRIADLAPLRGMPLTYLAMNGCDQIKSLKPLQGMPLAELHMDSCTQIRDLAILKELPLRKLGLGHYSQVPDLRFLDGMKLTLLDLSYTEIRDLTPLHNLPLKTLSMCYSGRIDDLTPLKGMSLSSLNLRSDGQISDLSPLKGMSLTSLCLASCPQITDLSPLHGMPLTDLNLGSCSQVKDLTPLAGMPLTVLDVGGCEQITDISPLKGMPLAELALTGCDRITDLTPLDGMQLIRLRFPVRVKRGVEVLRRMKTLQAINDTAAVEFWKKYDAGEFK
jgi:serine/threonine protein kinase/Leucine-rich repeat (LRR) protein